MKQLDIQDTLTFHGILFNRSSDGIYKSKEMGDELYLDSSIMRLPPNDIDYVKLKIIVNHLVSLESKWYKSYKQALSVLEVKTKPFTKLNPEKKMIDAITNALEALIAGSEHISTAIDILANALNSKEKQPSQ
jgi:hypothetical protein